MNRQQGKPVTGAPHREIELDFVRGIAILMVLDFHSPAPILIVPFRLVGFSHFGWAGVSVFFVLSGFLVGGLLMKEWRLKSRIDGRRFLIRRGFKIWPQYYVFLGVMLLTGHRTFAQLRGNLLNVQNYTGGIAHTWSLAVEEHAYILLTLFLGAAVLMRLRRRVAFWSLAGCAVVVTFARQYLAMHGYPFFSETHTRVDGILEGVLLAMLFHFRPELFSQIQRWTWFWIAALVAALCALRWLPSSHAGSAMSYNFANLLGVALLMLLYRHRPGLRRPVLYRVVAWIGLYSYGIYLWHVAAISPMLWVGHHLPPWAERPWNSAAPMAVGIALGYVATVLVEYPSLRIRDRFFPRRVDSAVGEPAQSEFKHLHPVASLPNGLG